MFNALGKMSSLTKKIVAEQAQRALLAMIKYTTCHARFFLPFLDASISEKNVQTRQYFSLYLKTYIEQHGTADRHHIEAVGLDTLLGCIKMAISDINPIVKENGRAAYWLFNEIWPKESAALLEKLDPTARKQLERARTVSDASTTAPQPLLRKPGTSSTSDAIRKARMEARGRSRIVSANAGMKSTSEATETSRRLSLQPQSLSARPATSGAAQPAVSPPRKVLPLTDSNLAHAEASGALASVASTVPPPEALGLRPSTPPTSRLSVRSTTSSKAATATPPQASTSKVPVQRTSPPVKRSPPPAPRTPLRAQRIPPKPRNSDSDVAIPVTKRSLPDSPSPASLSETLLDVDLTHWLDELPGRFPRDIEGPD